MTKFKSKAFIYYKPRDVRPGEIEIKCSPTDIIIKVLACARCGTDKTIYYKGHPRVDPNAPIVLGHELAGEIVEVGRKVKELKVDAERGFRAVPIMWPKVPKTVEEIEDLRHRVYTNRRIYGTLVSLDDKATLGVGGFFV